MPRGNNDNLIPFSERTDSEQTEIRKMGGKASGESRREKAAKKIRIKQIAELVIDKGVLPDLIKEIGGEADYKTAVDCKLLEMALNGNIKAIELFNRLYGDDPMLKLKQKEFELKEKEVKQSEQSRKTETPRIFEVLNDLQNDNG